MAATPLISIVIAVHHCERLLPATLRSIREQTCREWECILVDDGSRDGTLALAEEWAREDSRFRVITQTNAGTCAARNRGYASIDPASLYVTFMDHDDLWLPDALATLLAAAEAAPALAGAHGLADFIDEEGAPLLPGEFAAHGRNRIGLAEDGTLREWDFSRPTCFRTLLLRNTVFPPGVLLTRRAYYEKAGLFDPAMGLVEDWDMLLRLSRHGSFAFVNQVVVFYRRHRQSLSLQSHEANTQKVRALQHKAFCSPENTPEQKSIARQVWRKIQVQSMRMKWKAARAQCSEGKYAGAAATLARIYAEIHRFLRGYPTPRGL